MTNGEQQLPMEEWFANLFGVLYAQLYLQTARDMFPGTPAIALSPAQDGLVTARVDALVRASRQRIMPPRPPAADDRPGGTRP